VSWLYQPLPLAGVQDVNPDVTVALDATSTSITSEIGSLAIVNDEEGLQGQESAVEQGGLSRALSVRLRSRKTGGTSTAEYLLTTQVVAVGQGTALNGVSVLLGGTGVTTSQQSFPSKTVARLLLGQERTMSRGTLVYTPQGAGSGLPEWVQVPTQADEEAYYNTNFGPGSGKEIVWITGSGDKTPEFSLTPPNDGNTWLPPSYTVHGDLEADDLWNHYMQYKRTGDIRWFNWAQSWRNYYCGPYLSQIAIGSEEDDFNFDHMFGWGLVVWGMEQNDLTARETAKTILTNIEAETLANYVPGVVNMSNRESRANARRLMLACYVSMMEPIPRWITLRDLLIDCWVQSTGWFDSTNSAAVIGGNHFHGRSEPYTAGMTTADYDAGFRWNGSFMMGMHNQALWTAYKITGRTDLRDMLIEMARYVEYYAHDPLNTINPMCGIRFGHRPDGTHFHDHLSSFNGPQVYNTNPAVAPFDNYEMSLVNGLVYGYKLTGEAHFLARARYHFREATIYATGGVGATRTAADNIVSYVDTENDSSTFLFNYNKGQLQYGSAIFENGGLPEVEDSATWVPPYRVPALPGEVVKIAGDATPTANTIAYQDGDATLSEWPTNVWADVRPPEAPELLWGGDTSTAFMESYSEGGAIVIAGSGGHGGGSNFGACMFDFGDARWRRVWTTAGDPGVDNTSVGNVDIRFNTKIHNVEHTFGQLTEWYQAPGHNSGQRCWNPDHWASGASTAAQRANCPIEADPRNQNWEISHQQDSERVTYGGTHGYTLTPDEFGGDVQNRFPRSGYVAPSARFAPTPAGTLEPTQSELPAPGHIWNHFYEMTPDMGGGPRGSIITGYMQNAGGVGVTSLNWSHRFDLHTGIWHEFSINSPQPPTDNPDDNTASIAAGGPAFQGSTIAGCVDPVTNRAFMIAKTLGTGAYVTYMNLEDRTWRHFKKFENDAGQTLSNAGATEQIVVDPDRRLLIVVSDGPPYLAAIDLQTLGQFGTPEPTPNRAEGGWRWIPYDDLGGIQTVQPWITAGGAAAADYSTYPHRGQPRIPWRYYPPNGNFYRVNTKSVFANTPDVGSNYPTIPVLQRLTPPPIVSGSRPNFYYTTEAMSGRWTLDEITLSKPLPTPSHFISYKVHSFSWFHYVPALQCFGYCPLDSLGSPEVRRCVYLIKPY
jgi:hypothetical protein